MNALTTAKRLQKAASKTARVLAGTTPNGGYIEVTAAHREAALDLELRHLRSQMELACRIQVMFKEVAEEYMTRQLYFITVRPDETRTTWDAFREVALAFVERACFIAYHMAFEQKGTSEESLGAGYHIHIVAHLKQRSKGEVLRDTCSTFATMAAANCVKVQVLRTAADVCNARNYLEHHASADGHKAETAEWDALWRQRQGLEPAYVAGAWPSSTTAKQAEGTARASLTETDASDRDGRL